MTSQGTAHGAHRTRDPQPQPSQRGDRGAGDRRTLAAGRAVLLLLLAEVDPPRFDRAIARWHARFVLEAQGITADEAALALSAAKGLAGLKTRDVAARPCGDSPTATGSPLFRRYFRDNSE